MTLLCIRLGLLLSIVIGALPAIAQHLFTQYNSSNSNLLDNTIRAITPADDGTLWIGTDWGLAHFTSDTFKIYLNSDSPLPDNSIRSIAIDDTGAVWIGTFLGGVTCITDTGWLAYNTGNTALPDDHVKAIAFDTSNIPYFGTVGGVASPRDTGWLQYNIQTAPFDVDNISSAYIAPDNTHWYGTTNGGLMRLKNGLWAKFKNDNSPMPDNTVLAIVPVDTGAFWMAMPAGGAGFYNNQFSIYNTINSASPSNTYRSIAIDSSGAVYFASADKGLVQFSGNNNWIAINSNALPDTNGHFLPEDDLLSVAIDQEQNIWIGTTSSGLVKLQYVTIDSTIYAANTDIRNPEAPLIYIRNNGNTLQIKNLDNKVEVSIFNLSGQLLKQQSHFSVNAVMDISSLPVGCYLVLLKETNQQWAQRLVKR